MICRITNKIGTGAYEKVIAVKGDFEIVDVRQLVDKSGNPVAEIKKIIQSAVQILNRGKKIVICCDHGISRSNSIACGVLARDKNISFYDAVRKVMSKTGGAEMKPQLLDVVQQALELKTTYNKGENAVLLTGATGDIGTSLLPRLCTSFKIIPVSSNEINLLNELTLLHLLVKEKKVKTIIHLAHPRVVNTNTSMGEAITMMKNIIDVCLINKCRLIYVSSMDVNAASSKKEIISGEKTKRQAKGILGETKYLCEQLLRLKFQNKKISYCIIRLSAVYGKNCLKPKFLFNFISKARAGKKIETHRYSNGFPVVDLLHVDDAVKCIHDVLKNKITGEFLIGGGQPLSTNAIAKMIKQKMKSSSAISSISVRDKNCNIVADNKIAFKKTGWKPVRKFEEAIDELIKL